MSADGLRRRMREGVARLWKTVRGFGSVALGAISLLGPKERSLALTILVTVLVLRALLRATGLILRHFRTLWSTFHRRPARRRHPRAGNEPAWLGYLQQGAPDSLLAVRRDLRQACARELKSAGPTSFERSLGKSRSRSDAVLARWVGVVRRAIARFLGATVVLLAVLLLLPALLCQLLFWAVLLAGLGLCCAVCKALDQAVRRLLGTTTVCPHPACGRVVPLPVRLCPGCGAAHRRLVPGRYGAVHRTCRCDLRLPSGTAFGAGRLAAQCPHCSRPMLATGAPISLVLAAGAPGSGRSGVVRRAVTQLPSQVRTFSGHVGAGPVGTATAKLTGLRGGRRSLAVFDPPARVLPDRDRLDTLERLRHAHGLLLTLDARELPTVRRALTAADRLRLGPTAASGPDQVEAVERVLRTVTSLPRGRRPRRIAVVLTGTAALDHTSVGPAVSSGAANPERAVRAWLAAAGAGNLVRALDHLAVPVRFLADRPAAEASSELGGLLLWTAGIRLAARRRARPPRPVRTRRGPVPAGGAAVPRYALLLSHLAGFVALPLALVLPTVTVLSALPVLPAYERVLRPPAGLDGFVDLTQVRPGVSWPAFSASYSAPGSTPDGPRTGTVGGWSTAGSPSGGKPGLTDWLEVDFGVPVTIDLVDVVFQGRGPAAVEVQLPTDAGGWAAPAGERDDTSVAHLHEFTLPATVSAIRIAVAGGKSGVEVGGLAVWSATWTALRLHLSGEGLDVTNSSDSPVEIEVLPPELPAGWQAVPDGALPQRVPAGATVGAGWHVTGPAGDPPRPVRYALRLTGGGQSATAGCVALLRLTPAGPSALPITCG